MEHIDGFILLHAPARGWKRLAASPSSLLFPSFVLWLPKSPEDLLSERERGTLRRRVLFNKTKYYHETNYLKARKFLFWRVTAAKLLQSCLTLCMLWTVILWMTSIFGELPGLWFHANKNKSFKSHEQLLKSSSQNLPLLLSLLLLFNK